MWTKISWKTWKQYLLYRTTELHISQEGSIQIPSPVKTFKTWFGRWCEDTVVMILCKNIIKTRITTIVSSHHRPNWKFSQDLEVELTLLSPPCCGGPGSRRGWCRRRRACGRPWSSRRWPGWRRSSPGCVKWLIFTMHCCNHTDIDCDHALTILVG